MIEMIETGTGSITITVEAGGCRHDATMTLNCMAHDYAHLAGLACRKCYAQFWFSGGCCS